MAKKGDWALDPRGNSIASVKTPAKKNGKSGKSTKE